MILWYFFEEYVNKFGNLCLAFFKYIFPYTAFITLNLSGISFFFISIGYWPSSTEDSDVTYCIHKWLRYFPKTDKGHA